MRIFSFPYIAAADARILILGTMPGVKSLQEQQYYAHPQNNFWKILFTIYGKPFSTDYQERKNLLLENRIALWDVLQGCIRPGSLDSAITQEVPNDFVHFLEKHPAITHIFFNGQKAAHFFKKQVHLEKKYTQIILPSTSPANASTGFAEKLRQWQAIQVTP